MVIAHEVAVQLLQEQGVVDNIDIAILFPSDFSSLVEETDISDAIRIPYAQLPGFPALGPNGDSGALVIGRQEGLNVAYLQGYAHFYMSGDPAAMATPLSVVHALGARELILIANCVSIRADIYSGSLVFIQDHINMTGLNPLIGSIDETAFVNMAEAYDARMMRRLKRAGALSGVTCHEGVFLWTSGPSSETPMEIKLARMVGADVIGHAIAPETILARRLGMRVGAVGVVNNGAGRPNMNGGSLTKSDSITDQIGVRRIVRGLLRSWSQAVSNT